MAHIVHHKIFDFNCIRDADDVIFTCTIIAVGTHTHMGYAWVPGPCHMYSGASAIVKANK